MPLLRILDFNKASVDVLAAGGLMAMNRDEVRTRFNGGQTRGLKRDRFVGAGETAHMGSRLSIDEHLGIFVVVHP